MIADSEEEFYPEEIQKLKSDVSERGLGVVIFAEWYNKPMLEGMKFYDDNTRSWRVLLLGRPGISTNCAY